MRLLILANDEIAWISLPMTDPISDLKIVDCESKYKIVESLALYSNPLELNELSYLLEDLSKDDQIKLELILKSTQNVDNIKDLMNLIIHLDEFEIIKGITNYEELGKHYSDSYSFIKDYIELGKEICTLENGTFLNNYYIACPNKNYFKHYKN